jgi:hypothetical protein
MKVKTISYGRTVTMVGKFSSWRADAQVELQEGDSEEDAKKEAKRVVYFLLKEAIDAGAV